MSITTVSDAVADRAIEWFVRLRAEDVTDLERKDFFAWLKTSRENQRGFVEALQLWEDVAVVKQMRFEELKPFPQIWDFKKKAEASLAS